MRYYEIRKVSVLYLYMHTKMKRNTFLNIFFNKKYLRENGFFSSYFHVNSHSKQLYFLFLVSPKELSPRCLRPSLSAGMTSSGWILREQHKVYREQERTYKNGRNNKKLRFADFHSKYFLSKTLKKLNCSLYLD